MTERYFSVQAGGGRIYNGRHKMEANVTTMYNGYLVALSSGEIVASTGSPVGMAYDFMTLTELPTSRNLGTYMPGKYTNFVTGVFEALIGKDLFAGGAVPAVGTKLYDGGSGLVGTNATGSVIGVVEGTATVQNVAGAQTVARCKFNFVDIL